MPAALFSKEEVVERLADEFRRWGYDGATLKRLSDATGLGKASLYHHFPKGKEDMARAVLEHLSETVQKTVIMPLQGQGLPTDRLRALGKNLIQFYSEGHKSCILDVFSLGTASDLFREQVRNGMLGLKSAIAHVLEELGLSKEEAKARALRVATTVHGSLIVSRATGDRTYFLEAMHNMDTWLTDPSRQTVE